MSKTYSAGIVTAYGAAKRAGYHGTYEDFCRQQTGYAENAAAVEAAKTAAQTAANTATTKAGEATTAATAAQTAKTQTEQSASQALTDIAAARSGAISAVQTEGVTQTANATAQAQAAAQSANTASTKASEASASATSAGQSATEAAASATSAASSASAAQAVLESIPEEYSDLSEDVVKLKADLNANGIGNSFNGELFNGYWDANGVITKYSGDVCPLAKIPCVGNANVSVKGTMAIENPTLFISYYDSLGTTRIIREQVTGLEYNGTSPENTGFVSFTFEKSGLNKDNVEHVFVGIDNEFQKIDNKTRYILSFTDADLSNGFVIGQTGEIAGQFNNWKCTDYIPIPMMQGGTVNIRSTLYSTGGTAFYDENKNFISGVNGNNASDYGHQSHMLPQLRTYQIPKGTFYFRLSLFLYDSSITASRLTVDAYISSYGITQTINGLKDSIYSMNETESMYVNAGANYGHHNGGYSNVDKRFSVLVTTDVHGDGVRLERAVDYVNTMPCFDCGVSLGDIQGANYSDNDGAWYTNIIKQSKVNWLTLVGNHDFGLGSSTSQTGTVSQVYDKLIEPNLEYMGTIVNSEKCYYYKDYSDYDIRVICLNPYDVNNNESSGGEYVVNRYTEYYSQNQVDWLINVLNTTPSDYQVIIMVHNAPAPTTKNENIHFNNRILGLSPESTQSTLIVDIVNAWINGSTLSDTYACSNTNLSSVTVSADFTSRGSGIFVCYLTGHMHTDFVGYITKYSGQKVISLSATNAGTYQNGGRIDLPRADNTKAEDCITSFSVDTENKNIYLVRVGSSMSKWFDKREPSVISYA